MVFDNTTSFDLQLERYMNVSIATNVSATTSESCVWRGLFQFVPENSIPENLIRGGSYFAFCTPSSEHVANSGVVCSIDFDFSMPIIHEMNGKLISPNCGITLNLTQLHTVPFAKYTNKAINYLVLVVMTGIVEVFLLIQQMEYTRTPAVRKGQISSLFSTIANRLLTHQQT
jgi:hypothetical protein